MTSRPPRRHRAILLLILLGGFLLRLYQLGAQSLWYDETVSAFLAARDPAGLIAHTARDIHPPLYYLLLHFWARLAGDSEFALAFVSVIWGMLLVALTYHVARRLVDAPTGLLAAALVAISPYNVWYSQEVRMYTMGSFLGLITLDGLIRLWGDPRASLSWPTGQGRLLPRSLAAAPWLTWVLAAAAGLYALYYFAFLLVAENAFAIGYWAWRRRREGRAVDRLLGRWLSAQVAAVLLYLPWLPIAYRQATDPPVPPWRSFTSLWDVLRDSWSALTLGQSVKPEQVWPLLLVAVALYLLALWPLCQIRLLLAGYTFAPLALIFLVSYIVPLYHVRYVFLYAATFYIVLAWGVRRLWGLARPAWRTAVVGVIVIAYSAAASFSLFQFWTDPLYATDDYRAGVRYIARRLGPDDAVLINAGYVYTAFRYYYRGPIAWQGRLTDYPEEGAPRGQGAVIVQTGTVDGPPNLGWGQTHRGYPEADFYAMPWADTKAALERLFRHHPRIWMLRAYDTVSDPEGRIRAWLNEHGLLFDDRVLTGETNARVQGWRNHKQAWLISRPPQYPVGAYFGQNVLQLQGYNLPSTSVTAGQDLSVVLHWQRWAKPGSPEGQIDYSVSVGLFDAQGRRWAQFDEKPGAPSYPTSAWALAEVMEQPMRLPVPLGVPPGDYFLDATVYDGADPQAASGAVLAVTDPIWGVAGTRVRLGQVTVTHPEAWPEATWPDLPRRAAANFAGQVRLVRYEMPPGEFRPGQSVGVRLLWQAVQTPAEDNQIVLALLDKGGQPVATNVQPPAGGLHPMPRWLPGEVVLDHPTLLIPGRVPAGPYYRLAVAVRAPDGWLLRWRSGLFRQGEYYVLGELSLVAREVNFNVPPMAHRVDARLGETIRLLGFDLDRTQARPGETLALTLYWRALGETAESFKVFNHLVGLDGQLHGQQDGYPADGTQPTSGWVPNEVIVDRYTVRVADDAPAGTYRLLTGMYLERDFTRLPTFDAGGQPMGDTILLAEVTVTP